MKIYHPGGGRDPIGNVEITARNPLSPPSLNWAPAFAGVVIGVERSGTALATPPRSPHPFRYGAAPALGESCSEIEFSWM